jgi:hypothetical protein
LAFQDENPYSRFDIKDNECDLRGHNIRLKFEYPALPDATYSFVSALAGTAVLLMTYSLPTGWVTAAGYILDTIFITLDYYETISLLAYNQISGRDIEVYDRKDGLTQHANATALTCDYAVDASLGLLIDWIMETENNVGHHSLTIVASLEYYEYSRVDGSVTNKVITTSVNLKVGPDNNSFDTAYTTNSKVFDRLYLGKYHTSDFFRIYVDQGQKIDVQATARTGDPLCLYLFIYDPQRINKTSTGFSHSERINYTADSSGYWFIEVRAYGDTHGFYSLVIEAYTEGSGGGCPILYVYNGSSYINEGLLDIHNPEGLDVIYKHTLVTTPDRVKGAYLLRLVEHPQTHSYIDQVKLYAVLKDKRLIELPLIWAWHSEDGNVLPQLLFSDEWKADTLGADHNDGISQSMDLKFAALNPNMNIIGFVFQIEGNNIIVKT